MTDKKATKALIDFVSLQAIITSEGTILHGSEVHGVLAGLICGGFSFEDQNYLLLLTDLLHNGEKFSPIITATFKSIYNQLWQEILDDNFSFALLIADDDDTLAERTVGLCSWVQGFILGFGLQQTNTSKLSTEVQEVLTDFIEIANLSEDIDEDEDSEQAFFVFNEYVRISALLCFSELGVSPETVPNKNTLH